MTPATYEIEEILTPQSVTKFTVVVKDPRGFVQRFGAVGSRLPPDNTPGFWSINEAHSFIEADRRARALGF